MTNTQKRNKIKKLVNDMLKDSYKQTAKDLETILNSGCVDIDGWSAESTPMILPKCIVTAILQKQSRQYSATGTSFEKEVKKEVSNISHFI